MPIFARSNDEPHPPRPPSQSPNAPVQEPPDSPLPSGPDAPVREPGPDSPKKWGLIGFLISDFKSQIVIRK